MRQTIGFWKPASGFNPATLSPSLWVRASYAGSPWADQSGNSRDLSEATNPPATSAIGGFNAADFITNDRISRASTISTVCPSAGPFGITGLVWLDSVPADPGSTLFYTLPAILCDDTEGRLCVAVSSDGIRFGCFNGSSFDSTAASCATGGWHCFFASSDGTDFVVSVDAGGNSTLARGSISYNGAADTLVVGKNYDGSAFYDGKIAELLFKPSVFDATNRSNMRSYYNARYGLSL